MAGKPGRRCRAKYENEKPVPYFAKGYSNHALKDGFGVSHVGSDYTPDEIEFMNSMDRYKRENKRPFPTCCEVLRVLISLGYRKVGA